MKQIFTFCIIAVFCSCNVYQYITLSSTDMQQNNRHQFVMENDTMKLVYDFNGPNGQIKITVYNKLNKPLLVDLNRSALVVNNKAIGFNSGQVQLSSSVNASVSGPGIVSASGTVASATTLPQGSVFIPAGAFITQPTVVNIADKNLENIPADQFLPESFRLNDSTSRTLRTAHFTAGASPLVFKTYLTLVQPDAPAKETAVQHSFYASELRQTTTPPNRLNYEKRAAGNEFYVSKPNKKANRAGGVVALGALAAVILIIANNAHPPHHG